MSAPELSVVVPLFNEEAVVDELLGRIVDACERLDRPFEVVCADDASTDATPRLLAAAAAADPRIRPIRHDQNQGQFSTTRTGLRAARGALVVTLDGDLQDPPEVITDLMAAWRPGELDALCACKAARAHKGFAAVGSRLYAMLLPLVSAGALPRGAGSYCLMTHAVAQRIAALDVKDANLSAALALQQPRVAAVHYTKQERAVGESRVGLFGLVKEAIGSLRLALRARRQK